MNPVERVLDDELARLLDRLAASVPGGGLGAVSAMFPGLRARIDQVEAGLAILRGSLLESYGQWQRYQGHRNDHTKQYRQDRMSCCHVCKETYR